jgi:hypothetical protein
VGSAHGPKIREALNKAKAFPTDNAEWNKALFPEGDQFWTGK